MGGKAKLIWEDLRVPVVVAVITGIMSMIGHYAIGHFQSERQTHRLICQSRKFAYTDFIDRIRSDSYFRDLLAISSLSQRVPLTDGDVQDLEDMVYGLSAKRELKNAYSQFNSYAFSIKIKAKDKINSIIDDILNTISYNFLSIDPHDYPENYRTFISFYLDKSTTGISYGWDEKVTDEQRISILITSKLLEYLMNIISEELSQAPC